MPPIGNGYATGNPGPGATTTQTFKEVLASTALQSKVPGGVLLAQGFGVLNKGTVLGKITSSSKFGPYASTTTTSAPAAGATSISVADASAFIVGDNVTVGTDAAKAITAINYATNTLTLGTGLAAAQANDAAVKTNDGRQNAVCILDNDQDTTNNDVGCSAWDSGKFVASAITHLDANAQTALKMCMFY